MKLDLIQGDCLKEMEKIPDKSIDLILTDPPYNISYDEVWDKMTNERWKSLILDVLNESSRILRNQGSIWIFGGWSNISELRYFIGKFFYEKNWIIWDRQKGRGANYNFVSTREDIIWATKSNIYPFYTFNKQSSTIKKKTKGMGLKNGDEYRKLSNVWTDISPIVPWSKERVEHPTQKPLKLIERIIKISSNKGDTILDPFMGSGTTGVACKQLGRNFIGIEISPEYCKIAKERVDNCQIPLL